MAFATSNLNPGVEGNSKTLAGYWTGSLGDASGTMTLRTGWVKETRFENQDAESPKELPLTDVSYSDGTATITIHNHMNVTTGRFFIKFA